jgi:dTDP-glucose pyrophosphorylase
VILILTMAGRYQRFADEGYKTPKYLLPWGERVILWTILSELRKGDHFSDVFLIANQRDTNFMPHVRAILEDHGIPRDRLTLIGDTRGQAETAALGLAAVEKARPGAQAPVVFHNVDTILYRRDLKQVATSLKSVEGFIDVFGSNNRNYSYVLTDQKGMVCEIAEKIVVSDLATSGFYGFASADVFRKHYDRAADLYISAVYKRLIAAGGRVVIGPKHQESDTVVLGTPAEYINASLVSFAASSHRPSSAVR